MYVALVTAVAALAAGLAACGSGGSDGDDTADAGAANTPVVSRREDFPRPSGRSFRDLIGTMRQGPALAPSVEDLQPGDNRFGFGLFDRGSRQIGGLEVALYVSRGTDETAHGPYAARYEPIQVQGRYRSRTTAEAPFPGVNVTSRCRAKPASGVPSHATMVCESIRPSTNACTNSFGGRRTPRSSCIGRSSTSAAGRNSSGCSRIAIP